MPKPPISFTFTVKNVAKANRAVSTGPPEADLPATWHGLRDLWLPGIVPTSGFLHPKDVLTP